MSTWAALNTTTDKYPDMKPEVGKQVLHDAAPSAEIPDRL